MAAGKGFAEVYTTASKARREPRSPEREVQTTVEARTETAGTVLLGLAGVRRPAGHRQRSLAGAGVWLPANTGCRRILSNWGTSDRL